VQSIIIIVQKDSDQRKKNMEGARRSGTNKKKQIGGEQKDNYGSH